MESKSGAPERFAIRRARPDEAATLHQIQMRAFAEEGRLSGSSNIPPLTEEVGAIERQIRTQTVVTARAGGQIVGSARGLMEGTRCRIRAVMVEPSHQGRGIGAALLRAVEAAHPHVEQFVLTTNTFVPGNVAFYERRGYQVAALTKYNDRIVLAEMRKVVRAGPA